MTEIGRRCSTMEKIDIEIVIEIGMEQTAISISLVPLCRKSAQPKPIFFRKSPQLINNFQSQFSA